MRQKSHDGLNEFSRTESIQFSNMNYEETFYGRHILLKPAVVNMDSKIEILNRKLETRRKHRKRFHPEPYALDKKGRE